MLEKYENFIVATLTRNQTIRVIFSRELSFNSIFLHELLILVRARGVFGEQNIRTEKQNLRHTENYNNAVWILNLNYNNTV